MADASWTHLMTRPFIRPMIGTPIRPNHLTTLRLLSGLGACCGIALGTSATIGWGGVLWLVSAFLDRADGELARLGNLMSTAGHRYDYYADNVVNALFFVAAGVGLRDGWLGPWMVVCGAVSAFSIFVCGILSERLEQQSGFSKRAYSGRWGFDPDDALYLLAPFAWLGLLAPMLWGAAIGSTLIMGITGVRLLRSRLAKVQIVE